MHSKDLFNGKCRELGVYIYACFTICDGRPSVILHPNDKNNHNTVVFAESGKGISYHNKMTVLNGGQKGYCGQ